MQSLLNNKQNDHVRSRLKLFKPTTIMKLDSKGTGFFKLIMNLPRPRLRATENNLEVDFWLYVLVRNLSLLFTSTFILSKP